MTTGAGNALMAMISGPETHRAPGTPQSNHAAMIAIATMIAVKSTSIIGQSGNGVRKSRSGKSSTPKPRASNHQPDCNGGREMKAGRSPHRSHHR